MKLISIEDQIIKATISALLAGGFELSMFDGAETTVFRSPDLNLIFDAMKTTNEDYLFVYRGGDTGPHIGWVRFIYGNGETEVINDYTANLEPMMVKIMDLITEYEDEG